MDYDSRKKPQEATDMKDLPPKEMGEDLAAKVKGGVEPVNGLRSPKPVEPINGGR